MGQFDTQIRQADEIGKDWMKKSKEYESQFVVLKKNNMKWEKDTLTQLQRQIQQGAQNDPTTLQDMVADLEGARDRSKVFRKEAKRLFDQHETWSLDQPRKSMQRINEKLKLGGVGKPAYEAVAAGTKRQLTEVAGQMRTTQRAYKDVVFALDAMDKRIDGVATILVKGKSKNSAWTTTVKGMVKQFSDYCDNELKNYTVKSQTLADIRAGKFDHWSETQIKQQIQLYEANAAQADIIVTQLEKNYGRTLKSVPADFLAGFMVSAEKEELEKVKKATLATVGQRKKFWGVLKTTVEKHPPFAGKV